MSNQKIVTETALSALASDIKTALSGKANSNDVYPKSQTYNRTEIDNALELKADKSELYNVYPTDQESGSIVHIEDGADNIPVKSLVSQIVAVQSGSGTPSPSNPRAISGFSSVNVYVTGKNLFNLDKYLSDNNVSYTKDGEWFLFNLSNDLYNNKFDLLLDNYSVSFIVDTNRTTAVNPRLRLFKNGGVEGEVNANSSITKAIDQISFNFSTAGTICCKVQAEFGTTTSYEPFGNTYTFTFGQTVYGGHFDNKGNLVVTHGFITLDGSFNYSPNGATSDTSTFIVNILGKANGRNNFISDKFIVSDSLVVGHADGRATSSNIAFCLPPTVAQTAVAGKQWFTDNPTQLVYELANPITLSITSQDIPTLSGENNIFSNCGDVEVDYHADIGLYIDKKISSLAQG